MTYFKIRPSIRVADLDGVAKEIINYLDEQDLSQLADYELIVEQLRLLQTELSAAIDRTVSESALAERDRTRMHWLSAINVTLNAALVSPIDEQKQAAKELRAVFDRYGLRLRKLNYAARSAKINSLLGDYENESLLASIEAVPAMNEFLSNLRAAQLAFEEDEVAYDHARTIQKNTDAAVRVKPKLLAVTNHLVDYHRAMQPYKGADFERWCNTIDTIIREANMLISSRSKKK